MMLLIPTFEVGQRVVWHPQPIECVCPLCGAPAAKASWGKSICGKVLYSVVPPVSVRCVECDGYFDLTMEGWYLLDLGFKHVVTPHTLIEPIEEVLDANS
jgi:hypothetical protein